ncbi:MAG: cbb3-type cytochrome c oxidase N-terminal domain-containing protein [Saprospiraceae bacterium]
MKSKFLFSIILAILGINQFIYSQGGVANNTPVQNDPYDMVRYMMIFVCLVLLIIIVVLGNALLAASKQYLRNKINGNSSKILSLVSGLITLSFWMFPNQSNAQSTTVLLIDWGLIPMDIWAMIILGILEFIIIVFISNKIKGFVTPESEILEPKIRDSWLARIWRKANNFRPIEQEYQIDSGHNYDGIRELDNKVPGWWSFAFLGCILFGAVYMYRYHIAYSAPLPLEELSIAQAIAAKAKAEYMKNQAESIDENSVVMSDAGGIAEGAELFKVNCVVCHLAQGQGSIGPNLTDDYWINKGGLKDIFATIKYGVPAKGMKSWVEDFSPRQIANLASFVKSLRGSNPPNPKEKQGELYVEESSGSPSVDTTKNTKAVDSTSLTK